MVYCTMANSFAEDSSFGLRLSNSQEASNDEKKVELML